MKKVMQSVSVSAAIAIVLAVAAADVAKPAGVQAQVAGRCTGDAEPVCATVKTCRGIWWWRECGERSFYWNLAPPPAPVD